MAHSRFIGLLAMVFIFASCSVMKKNTFKDTVWTGEYRMFVADAGYETTTVELSFTSGKDFKMTSRSTLPPHPAMYMNPDGTVDTLPGFSREYEQSGTYTIGDKVLSLQMDDGTSMELLYGEGYLECGQFPGEKPCRLVRKPNS